MSFPAFPKIFTLGQKYISNIFDDEVEVTEKIDGSQFAFTKVGNELKFRSKGREFIVPDKMFEIAVQSVEAVQDYIPNDIIFYGEYLQKPKHNVLTYSNVPQGNICIFGAMNSSSVFMDRQKLELYCEDMGFDVVPIVYKGKLTSPEQVKDFLERESYLGGAKIEGVVVKNYAKSLLVRGQVLPITCGKYVSEAFKEVHGKSWSTEHTSKGNWESYIKTYQTEARWQKALQHLRDNGLLTDSPKDIGPLIKEVQKDITEECKEDIKEALWTYFGRDLIRISTNGLPEWYKDKLLEESFNGN